MAVNVDTMLFRVYSTVLREADFSFTPGEVIPFHGTPPSHPWPGEAIYVRCGGCGAQATKGSSCQHCERVN